VSNYLLDGYRGDVAAFAPENARVAFIRRTYLHVACSVAALAALEFALLKSGVAEKFLSVWMGLGVAGLIASLVLFIGGGFLARYMARGDMPVSVKYLGLAGYICIQAVFLLPILYIASNKVGNGLDLIAQASILTLITFAGLTLTVFLTKADFSGLGSILAIASWVILGVVVTGALFGFGMGLWISFICVALAAGYILYDTSNILHHYNTNEHVGASLELLADIVLLFYHILRILLLSGRND
jgi:FtsH-binding integral membrane protein